MPDLYENLPNSSHSKLFSFGQFRIWIIPTSMQGAGEGTNRFYVDVTAAWIGNSPFCFLLIAYIKSLRDYIIMFSKVTSQLTSYLKG